MWTRQELKGIGKTALKANYWKSVIAAFLLALLAGGVYTSSRSQSIEMDVTPESLQQGMQSIPLEAIALISGALLIILLIALVLKIFFFNPLKVGCFSFFRKNVTDPGTKLDMILSGFSQYGRTFVTLFLSDLYVFLWCLLLVIPGLMKAYSYRLVPYILADDPELSPREVLEKSQQMMDGQRWNAFVYDLSFLGWEILGVLTFGVVNLLWTNPYKENADAALYLRLRGEI
ncbi:MAG: DUF975 family protein [Lachnospiraceae bacterium]|nr:DUF975 family protein [Lachnospiraceae bacterium]